MLPYGARSG